MEIFDALEAHWFAHDEVAANGAMQYKSNLLSPSSTLSELRLASRNLQSSYAMYCD